MARVLVTIWRLLRELVVDLVPSGSGVDGRDAIPAHRDDVLDAARDDDGADATGL